MELINAVAKTTRKLRMADKLQPKMRTKLYVMCRTERVAEVVRKGASEIATLCQCHSVEREKRPLLDVLWLTWMGAGRLTCLLLNVVDANVEIFRLQKKCDDLLRQQDALLKKGAAGYIEKVPEAVREESQSKAKRGLSLVSSPLNFKLLRIPLPILRDL